MKLYSVPHSPYASRVRIQIRAGALPVSVEAPEGGLGSDTFKALTPTGKVPTLHVDGHYLVESVSIMEYLEERFPEAALLPEKAEQRAWLRAVSRFTDLELAQALFPLFMELRLKTGDKEAIARNISALKDKLAILEKFLKQSNAPELGRFGFLDCLLAPVLFYVEKVPAIFGETAIFAATPQLKDWWQASGEHEHVAPILEEMAAGLAASMGG